MGKSEALHGTFSGKGRIRAGETEARAADHSGGQFKIGCAHVNQVTDQCVDPDCSLHLAIGKTGKFPAVFVEGVYR